MNAIETAYTHSDSVIGRKNRALAAITDRVTDRERNPAEGEAARFIQNSIIASWEEIAYKNGASDFEVERANIEGLQDA